MELITKKMISSTILSNSSISTSSIPPEVDPEISIFVIVITSVFIIGILSSCFFCIICYCLNQLRTPVYLPITNIFEVDPADTVQSKSLFKHTRKTRRQKTIKAPKPQSLRYKQPNFSSKKSSRKSLQLALISHAGMFNFKKAYEDIDVKQEEKVEAQSNKAVSKTRSTSYQKSESDSFEYIDH